MRTVLRIAATALLALLAAPMAWQLATGDTYMRVLSGSMVPTYQVGDLLIVSAPAGDDLTRVGQVVVIEPIISTTERPIRYVHRVASLTEDGAYLRGDANDADDPRPVTQEQVVGVPRTAIGAPWAGLLAASQTLVGRLVLAVTALVLLLLPGRRRRPAGRRVASGTGTSTDGL